MNEADWAAGILDREFYQVGYPVADHLFFAPWKGLGALGRHMAESKAIVRPTNLYFLHQACLQGIAAGAGEIWELGVFQGESAAFLASLSASCGRTLRLFDTFEGMPETDPVLDRFHKGGDFSDTSLQRVRDRVLPINPDVQFCPGFVPDTFAGYENATISFAHVDLDIYHPIKASCEFIFPRMPVGGAMIFDDYGWASCPGARQAVDEYFEHRPEIVFSLPTAQALVIKTAP